MDIIDKNFLFDDNELNVYSLYVLANYAKKLFREEIERLDKDNTYIKITIKEGIPKEIIDKAKELYQLMFSDKIEELNKIKKEWKILNSHYYREQPSLP